VVAKVRKILAVSKQVTQNFYVEKLTLRKLSELEVRKQDQIEISKSLAVLETSGDSGNINRSWENNKESIQKLAKESLCLYKLKHHKHALIKNVWVF
jgi:hypothetical protein